jgi:hypothetical protein
MDHNPYFQNQAPLFIVIFGTSKLPKFEVECQLLGDSHTGISV